MCAWCGCRDDEDEDEPVTEIVPVGGSEEELPWEQHEEEDDE